MNNEKKPIRAGIMVTVIGGIILVALAWIFGEVFGWLKNIGNWWLSGLIYIKNGSIALWNYFRSPVAIPWGVLWLLIISLIIALWKLLHPIINTIIRKEKAKLNDLRYIFTGSIGRKIWTTLSLVLIYRLLLHIPLPGFTGLSNASNQTVNGVFTLVEFADMLSGGDLLRTSILGLGLLPYKIAGLLLETFTQIIPTLQKRLEEDPHYGHIWLERWKYYLAIPLGIAEALSFIGLVTMDCNGQKFVTLEISLDVSTKITIIATLVAGSFVTLWISNLIDEFGLRGQGKSIIILSGIVSRLPHGFIELLTGTNVAKNITLFFVVFIISIFLTVLALEGRQNIPIMLPRRRVGARMSIRLTPTIPLVVNIAGVEGFVGSQLWVAIATFYAPLLSCSSVTWIRTSAYRAITIFSENNPLFGPLVFFSVFTFTIFYSEVIFNQQDISKNLKRAGARIPGIIPGTPTRNYLLRIVRRLSIISGLILGLIAIIPWASNLIAGTALPLLGGEKTVIMVGIIRDMLLSIDAEKKMRLHDGGAG